MTSLLSSFATHGNLYQRIPIKNKCLPDQKLYTNIKENKNSLSSCQQTAAGFLL